MPYADLLEEILALVREDAEHLGCVWEVEHARAIVRRGTSAHAQRWVYNEALRNGADKKEALQAVVDWLIEATRSELHPPAAEAGAAAAVSAGPA